MPNDKRLTTTAGGELANASEAARRYARSSKAANTQRAYGGAWQRFGAWAAGRDAESLPASVSTVVEYLTALADAGASVSTIGQARAAISAAHRGGKHTDPTKSEDVKIVLSGITRMLGTAAKKKAPVSLADLRAIVRAMPDNLLGKRDRALLLVGFAGAFRRSELVALDVADMRINDRLHITVKRSKADQEGRGQVKAIPSVDDAELDPVRAMREWLNSAEIKSGPVFRRVDRWGHLRAERLAPQGVALVLKRAALAAGLEPRQFAGHSLRSGFITAAVDSGARESDIQGQTGHRSTEVLRGYIRDAGRGAERAVRAAFKGRAEKDED